MEKTRLIKLVLIAAVVIVAFFCWCYAKKSDTVRKWGWRIIGAATAIFLVFTVWYHVPITCQYSGTVYAQETLTPLEVEIEAVVHRSYLYGTWVEGSARTSHGEYPNCFSNKKSLSLGERKLSAVYFCKEHELPACSINPTMYFSWDWRSVHYLELWDFSKENGNIIFYCTDWDTLLEHWQMY